MIVFYDPGDGQVMAIYSGDTESTVWVDRGFLKAEVPPDLIDAVGLFGRDGRVTVLGADVTGVSSRTNPVQPVKRQQEIDLPLLHGKLQDGSITQAEITEMLRLERSL